MKKMIRTVLCAAVLMMAMCTGVYAAEGSFHVQFNGEALNFSDAAPRILNDRSYLPFRAVFTALGFADENITFDAQSRTVAAVSPELTVCMVIGENRVTVIRDHVATVLDTDVPAMIDPDLGRTYVPVSFVAQAVGFRVGWNTHTRTVIIDDVERILAENTETYQILEKYMEYDRSFRKGNYAVQGSCLLRMITQQGWWNLNGPCEMLMSGNTGFDMNAEMGMTGILAGMDLSGAVPEGLKLNVRGDMEQGLVYFRSDMFAPVMDAGSEQMWFRADVTGSSDLLLFQEGMLWYGMPIPDQNLQTLSDGRACVEQMVRADLEKDNGACAAERLEWYNAVLGDSAFTKQDTAYVNEVDLDGGCISVTFFTDGARVNGYRVTERTEDPLQNTGMELDVAVEKDRMSFLIRTKQDAEEEMEFRLDGQYTTTQTMPTPIPDGGTPVTDISQLMGTSDA